MKTKWKRNRYPKLQYYVWRPICKHIPLCHNTKNYLTKSTMGTFINNIITQIVYFHSFIDSTTPNKKKYKQNPFYFHEFSTPFFSYFYFFIFCCYKLNCAFCWKLNKQHCLENCTHDDIKKNRTREANMYTFTGNHEPTKTINLCLSTRDQQQ